MYSIIRLMFTHFTEVVCSPHEFPDVVRLVWAQHEVCMVQCFIAGGEAR